MKNFEDVNITLHHFVFTTIILKFWTFSEKDFILRGKLLKFEAVYGILDTKITALKVPSEVSNVATGSFLLLGIPVL